jgi:hypothetical protein
VIEFFAGVGATLLAEAGLLAALIYAVWKRKLKW